MAAVKRMRPREVVARDEKYTPASNVLGVVLLILLW